MAPELSLSLATYNAVTARSTAAAAAVAAAVTEAERAERHADDEVTDVSPMSRPPSARLTALLVVVTHNHFLCSFK